MKKIIIGLFILTAIYMVSNKETCKEIIIPNNAIRFRVIANSNSVEDQLEKNIIKDNIEKEVLNYLSGASSRDDAKELIQEHMEDIEKVVSSYNIPYNISYGYNYFPSKSYKGVLYGAGNYESLVITLGSGLGNNFWCVLFPPLCAVEDIPNLDNVEYQFYVKKILEKF